MGASQGASGACTFVDLRKPDKSGWFGRGAAPEHPILRGIQAERRENTRAEAMKMRENPASQELFRCAWSGDVRGAMMALVSHADANACNGDGLTPLMMGAAGGHLEVVRLLVTSKARVNVSTARGGLSALSIASAQGHHDLVRTLLQWQAELEVTRMPGSSNGSPLGRAAAAGQLTTCALLLDQKADVGSFDERGVTPLMLSVDFRRLEITQLLIDRNAPLGALDRDKRCALRRAVEVLFTIVEPPPQAWEQSSNIWAYGALQGHLSEFDYWCEIVRTMVSHYADLHVVDQAGHTLVSQAVRQQRPDVVNLLLKLHAHPDQQVPALNSGPVLLQALELRMWNLCRRLVEHGASVNKGDSQGVTPLCLALDSCSEAECSFLIDQGANTGLRDPRTGETMLMKAAGCGLKGIYDRLLAQGRVSAIDGVPEILQTAPGHDDQDAEYLYSSEGEEEEED